MSQIQYLIQNFSKLETDSIEQVVFDNTNYLYSGRSNGGAYILLPNAGDYSEIQDVFKNIFEESSVIKEGEEVDESFNTLINKYIERYKRLQGL